MNKETTCNIIHEVRNEKGIKYNRFLENVNNNTLSFLFLEELVHVQQVP